MFKQRLPLQENTPIFSSTNRDADYMKRPLLLFAPLTFLLTLLVLGFGFSVAWAGNIPYTNDQLANAIYRAEGGAKTRHPYGIFPHYKHTTPRQACLNTIKSAQRRFAKQTKEKDFVHFLSLTYCPIGASNDPKGLNKNWVRLVNYFLTK